MTFRWDLENKKLFVESVKAVSPSSMYKGPEISMGLVEEQPSNW
jgi:hypothetical protein